MSMVNRLAQHQMVQVLMFISLMAVTFESKITGMLASGRSNADTLDVPYGARRVNVTIKVRADAVSAFGGATKLGIANVEVLR